MNRNIWQYAIYQQPKSAVLYFIAAENIAICVAIFECIVASLSTIGSLAVY